MTTNVHVDNIQDSASNTESTGDDADAGDSQVTLTFGDLRGIEEADDVNIQAEGGYVAEVDSVIGNKAVATVYVESDTGGALATASVGTSVTVSGNAFGY